MRHLPDLKMRSTAWTGRLLKTTSLVAFLFVAICFAAPARAHTLEWTRQLGTSKTDSSISVAADELGSVYISGYTGGSLGGPNAGGNDAFISKYDASGTLQWTRQLGTSGWDASTVSADGLGSAYISGFTEGSLGRTNQGEVDAFLSKYDASGTRQWTQQLGTSPCLTRFGVVVDVSPLFAMREGSISRNP